MYSRQGVKMYANIYSVNGYGFKVDTYVSLFVVILVHIFPAFSRVWTEYGEIYRISSYSERMRENAGKIQATITPNTDTFYVV